MAPIISASVDVALLVEQPKAALLAILNQLPGWAKADEEHITVVQFSGAMTNMVYRCGLVQSGQEVQVVLMRVHASASDLFDRQAEIDTFKGVSKAGMGPQLLLLFDNGRVEQFLSDHVTLAAADLQDAAVSAAIAQTLAQFHFRISSVLSGSSHHQAPVQLWCRLQEWYGLARQVMSQGELQQLGLARLDTEIAQLEQLLTSAYPCWVALCHNDLQYGNIMARTAQVQEDAIDTHSMVLPTDSATVDYDDAGSSTEQQPGSSNAAAGVGKTARQLMSDQLRALQLADAAAVQQQAIDIPAAAQAQHQRLQQLQQQPSDLVSVVSGDSLASLSSDIAGQLSHTAVAGSSPATSVVSLTSVSVTSTASLNVRGRSPGRIQQMPDGSLVLPGMKARLRGQSPDRDRKRPDQYHDILSSAASRKDSLASSTAAELMSAAGMPAQQQLQLQHRLAAAAMDSHNDESDGPKPPSAAAVLRHAPSAGELFAPVGSTAVGTTASSSAIPRRVPRISEGAMESPTVSAANSPRTADARVNIQQGLFGSSSSDLTAESASAAAVGEHDSSASGLQQPPSEGHNKAYADVDFPSLQASKQHMGPEPDSITDTDSILSQEHGSDSPNSSSSSSGLSDEDAAIPTSSMRDQQPAAADGAATVAVYSERNEVLLDQQPDSAQAGWPVQAAVKVAAAGPQKGKSLTLIDYEYSGFNPIAYDIANHWCEWAADYHTDQPHVLNFSRLPTEEQQREFVHQYLRVLLRALGVKVQTDSAAAAASADGSAAAAAGVAGAVMQLAHGAAAAESVVTTTAAAAGRVGGLELLQRSVAGKDPGALAGRAADDQSDVWSTVSCSGGSVYSLPDASDAGCAGNERAAGDAAQSKLGNGPLAGVNGMQLRDVWHWLGLFDVKQHQQQQHGSSSGIAVGTTSSIISEQQDGLQLDAAGWQQVSESLLQASRAYMAPAHLLWALWGVIQSKVSDVDFDYDGYSQQKWQQYLLTRPSGLQQK